jgi:hypothetical protein
MTGQGELIAVAVADTIDRALDTRPHLERRERVTRLRTG